MQHYKFLNIQKVFTPKKSNVEPQYIACFIQIKNEQVYQNKKCLTLSELLHNKKETSDIPQRDKTIAIHLLGCHILNDKI